MSKRKYLCHSSRQYIGYGATEKIGALIECPVCFMRVKVMALFGRYDWPSYAPHVMPTESAGEGAKNGN